MLSIQRPPYRSITVKQALALPHSARYRWEEKMDGEFACRKINGAVIVGEAMRGGDFYAFDMVELMGVDLRVRPFRERIDYLTRGYSRLGPSHYCMPSTGPGPEFLEAVLARGGEGVVIKDLDAPYGSEWIKVKRVETWDLIVMEKAAGKASIHLKSAEGEDFGWCPCRAGYDSLKIGDVVEIAAYGRHASGKLREPRFIRLRGDKMRGDL